MRSPIERMVDAVVRCVRCDKLRDDCRCYVTCRCGYVRIATDVLCPSSAHDDFVTPQLVCACARPEHKRRECADAQGNKRPCRCHCHFIGDCRREMLEILRDKRAASSEKG